MCSIIPHVLHISFKFMGLLCNWKNNIFMFRDSEKIYMIALVKKEEKEKEKKKQGLVWLKGLSRRSKLHDHMMDG